MKYTVELVRHYIGTFTLEIEADNQATAREMAISAADNQSADSLDGNDSLSDEIISIEGNSE